MFERIKRFFSKKKNQKATENTVENIGATLSVSSDSIIEPKEDEKLGFIGRKEGVTVHAVANLTYLLKKSLPKIRFII